MSNTFKPFIDRQIWISSTPSPTQWQPGYTPSSDMRNNKYANPFIYQYLGALSYRYSTLQKAWQPYTSPGLSGSNTTGATSVFAPSFSNVGTIAAGATTTSVTLSTALAQAVGLNSLSNHGNGGFILRIIDTTAGKIVEREIVANTASTTPVITVASSFGFVPATGSRYEILAGRVFYLNSGTVVAGIFKSIDIAANIASGNLATLNLPGTISTDSSMIALDEQYVPYNCVPGEGMIKGSYEYTTGINALSATATSTNTLTGQATGGDAVVAANEYRNFQIRIVEDTTTPAAVGQRRIISSNTAGASPVYTLTTNWTTTPSSSAKFVIELPNLILLRTSATTSIYVYNYTDATLTNAAAGTIASGSWSTTYFAAATNNHLVNSFWMPSWGIQPDVARLSRQSFCYYFRGSGWNHIDLFDIAGGTTGAWTNNIAYDGAIAITAGSCGTNSPFGFEGRYGYLTVHSALAVNTLYKFDLKNRILTPAPAPDDIQGTAGGAGQRFATYAARDGSDLYDIVFFHSNNSTKTQELIPLV